MPAPTPAADVRRSHRAEPDAVALMIARWRAAGTWFVVLDERGRHAAELDTGRLDLSHAPMVDAGAVDATLHRHGFALLDGHNVPRDERPLVLGRALTAVQRLRVRTGRPEWVLIEDAPDVLRQQGIPPHAVRLADGGYVLVARDGRTLPPAVTRAAGFDVRLSAPGLELSLIPPVGGDAEPSESTPDGPPEN